MTQIRIPRTIVNRVLEHAQSSENAEICGLIGEKDNVYSCYPVHNVSDNPESFYAMDGKELINSMRQMRDNGESLFAIYHSHPKSDAYPSSTDLKEAQYPDANYLIVSLNTKGVLDLRAYRLIEGKIEILEVAI